MTKTKDCKKCEELREKSTDEGYRMIKELREQRDELLQALKNCHDVLNNLIMTDPQYNVREPSFQEEVIEAKRLIKKYGGDTND